MTFSEDPATPAAPFSGDGSIFDQPDVLMSLPTTNERVVDTQSGFLLVIRRMGERLALSCKRRVGTPPSSAILLTADESIKLSKILAYSTAGIEYHDGEASAGSSNAGNRRRFAGSSGTGRRRRLSAIAIAALLVCIVVACFGGGLLVGKLQPTSAPAVSTNQLSAAAVDRFARRFVSEMLDFNPETYKVSQVSAMSAMVPELLEKYWQETNFPLSRKQLKSLPQGTTMAIDQIVQQRQEGGTAVADVYAQLIHPETKISSPVHIKLTLALSPEGQIRVVGQEDLTSTTPKPTEGE
jgi:hypothetical protein